MTPFSLPWQTPCRRSCGTCWSVWRAAFPKQVNNVVAFPGIFKGALEGHARQITEEMKLAAAEAIASLVPEEELSDENIMPEAFNPKVAEVVAAAVKAYI